MMVVVKPDLPVFMAGSCAPGVVLSVAAIGAVDTAEKNRDVSSKIFSFLTQELGLTQDRSVVGGALRDAVPVNPRPLHSLRSKSQSWPIHIMHF